MKALICRCIACSAGVIASHPLDTLKLRAQTKQKINLLAGIETPIIFNSISKGVRFHIFSVIKPYSLFIALFSSGIYSGLTEASYYKIKLQRQLGKKLYHGGGHIIFIKELIATFIHLFLFNYYFPELVIHQVLYGGMIATVSTSIVYPSDRFFVNYKTHNMSVLESIKENRLWEGFHYNILKTFVFNS